MQHPELAEALTNAPMAAGREHHSEGEIGCGKRRACVATARCTVRKKVK